MTAEQRFVWEQERDKKDKHNDSMLSLLSRCGLVAEWLACWTHSQKGPGFKSQPRRCRVTVLGKLFTPVVSLLTKQQNW